MADEARRKVFGGYNLLRSRGRKEEFPEVSGNVYIYCRQAFTADGEEDINRITDGEKRRTLPLIKFFSVPMLVSNEENARYLWTDQSRKMKDQDGGGIDISLLYQMRQKCREERTKNYRPHFPPPKNKAPFSPKKPSTPQ